MREDHKIQSPTAKKRWLFHTVNICLCQFWVCACMLRNYVALGSTISCLDLVC